jgi:hypothetical protein
MGIVLTGRRCILLLTVELDPEAHGRSGVSQRLIFVEFVSHTPGVYTSYSHFI